MPKEYEVVLRITPHKTQSKPKNWLWDEILSEVGISGYHVSTKLVKDGTKEKP